MTKPKESFDADRACHGSSSRQQVNALPGKQEIAETVTAGGTRYEAVLMALVEGLRCSIDTLLIYLHVWKFLMRHAALEASRAHIQLCFT